MPSAQVKVVPVALRVPRTMIWAPDAILMMVPWGMVREAPEAMVRLVIRKLLSRAASQVTAELIVPDSVRSPLVLFE